MLCYCPISVRAVFGMYIDMFKFLFVCVLSLIVAFFSGSRTFKDKEMLLTVNRRRLLPRACAKERKQAEKAAKKEAKEAAKQEKKAAKDAKEKKKKAQRWANQHESTITIDHPASDVQVFIRSSWLALTLKQAF